MYIKYNYMKNFNLTNWMRDNHPEILKQFEQIKLDHKRKMQRERSRKIYELAKQALKNQG